MLAQVPRPMFVNYFPPFAPWRDSAIKADSCLWTVGNDGYKCSLGKNTILSETGDASMPVSSNVATLDCGSSGDKSITWSDFVVSMNNDIAIGYARISIEGGTASSLVGVSESKLPVELESGKAWQASSEP